MHSHPPVIFSRHPPVTTAETLEHIVLLGGDSNLPASAESLKTDKISPRIITNLRPSPRREPWHGSSLLKNGPPPPMNHKVRLSMTTRWRAIHLSPLTRSFLRREPEPVKNRFRWMLQPGFKNCLLGGITNRHAM